MKKTICLLLGAALLLSLMLPAAATTIYPPVLPPIDLLVGEYGYTYTLTETEDGDALSDVRYKGDPDSDRKDVPYVPKTLGGVTVTNETLDGRTYFYGSVYVSGFTVDDDNDFFSVREGMLYSKDGQTLVYYPDRRIGGVCRIPDGTAALGACSMDVSHASDAEGKDVCVVFPASVTQIDPDFAGGASFVVAGYADTAARRYAEEHDLTFLLLGEGHTHTYFRTVTPATCTARGEVLVVCPCGVVVYGEETPELGHSWSRRSVEKEDGKIYEEVYCSACGEVRSSFVTEASVADGCDCLCHKLNRTWAISLTKDNWKEVFRNAIFRCKLAVWRLAGINQYCACGVRHY